MKIKQKIIISIVVVLSIMGLVIYLIIFPTINEIKGISDAVYAERLDLEKKYLRGQLLRKTIKDFEDIKPKEDKLASIFIVEGEELEFIKILETIASRHNLEQDISFQAIKNVELVKGYYSLPLGLTTKGGFINTLSYLKDLEQLNYYFNVSAITISSVGQEVNTRIEGTIFALPAEEDEGNI